MSSNIDQIFIANPITTNNSTDLMYFGRSGVDAAMRYSSFSAQFASAMAIQNSSFNYAVDTTGTGDNIIVNYTPAITTLVDGAILMVNETVSANTGNGTVPQITVNGLTAAGVLIESNGSPTIPYPGDISLQVPAILYYSGNFASFILLNPQSAMSIPDLIANGNLYTVTDTGVAANTYVGSFTNYMKHVGSSPVFAPGLTVDLIPAHTNTGASTFDLNGTSAIAIVQKGGAAITAGMMVANYISTLKMTPGGTWQLMNPA